MAEKRKLPARAGRESANKKRASEAGTPQSQPKKKAATPKAPTPRIPTPPPPEPVEPPLPSKINEGDPLPIRRTRQPGNLSDSEYQSIAESAVMLLSLERSKKKWLSDGILVRFYTKPKKTKREQIEKMNPPKESMVKVGLCDVTVGPHLFDAMIYTVKDPTVPQPVQYAPPQPQTRMVHYGPGSNFQQHQPYQSNQQRRPPYTPAPPGRPQGYQGNYSPAPRGPHQPGHATPQSGQRPQTQSQPGQPAKPSPDPVIQMLATRAAADPELKALMRVVASSQASQEQLRAFQAHIDELNAIIKAREQQEKRQQASVATTPQQSTATPSQNKPNPPANTSTPKTDPAPSPPQAQGSKPQPTVAVEIPSKNSSDKPSSGTQATESAKQPEGQPQSGSQPQTPVPAQKSQSSSASQAPGPAVKQESTPNGPASSQPKPLQPATSTPASAGPAITPAPATGFQQQQSPMVHPTPSSINTQQSTPRPGAPYSPYQQPAYGSQPALQSRPSQYGSPTPYSRPPGPTTLPHTRPPFKAVVFEFTSPLTPYGSSTSGHAGSGDRYLFPEYSILEWIPSENTILASFLITRKVDPNTPFPIEAPTDPTNNRGKSKGTSKSKKGDKKGKGEKGKDVLDTPTPNQVEASTSKDIVPKVEPTDKSDKPTSAQPGAPGTPSEQPVNEANLKEYWQPVTFRIHASDTRVLEPLTRVVKPADEVRKYMNEIMDRAERAPDGFLALRLPTEEAREAFEAESTPASITNPNTKGNRPARGSTVKVAEGESEVENNPLEIEEEEEDLLDFYGSPSGLAPIGA